MRVTVPVDLGLYRAVVGGASVLRLDGSLLSVGDIVHLVEHDDDGRPSGRCCYRLVTRKFERVGDGAAGDGTMRRATRMTDLRLDNIGPVDHIARQALPWRTRADLTECGKPVAEVAERLVSRADALARVKRVGAARASYTLCVTCSETSDRRHRFDPADAVAVVARETEAAKHASPPINYRLDGVHDTPRDKRRLESARQRWEERQRLNTEFDAIAALVDAHRDEFEAYIAGRAAAVSLDDRRAQRRRRGQR